MWLVLILVVYFVNLWSANFRSNFQVNNFSISLLYQKLKPTEDVDKITQNVTKFFPGEAFEVACNCTHKQPAIAGHMEDCKGIFKNSENLFLINFAFSEVEWHVT